MNFRPLYAGLLSFAWSAAVASAGERTAPPAEAKTLLPPAPLHLFLPETPAGLLTVGGLFSEHLSGVFVDTITGLYANRERTDFLFYNSRSHYEDNSQFIQSNGLAYRRMVPGQEVIFGANVFYDAIHSERGNDYNQLGLGAEVLSHYVDARVNYYLPENKRFEVDRFSRRNSSSSTENGTTVTTSRRRTFQRTEEAVEGLNFEVGVLIPGLEKYVETRLFAGYHHYNNPYGSDFEGFQARLELRLLPGVIADVEYWEDARLMGGHWTAGLRGSVPFSLIALARGHNPFAGAGDMIKPGERAFGDRLGEMIIRSHRIQTVTSGPRLSSERFHRSNSTAAAPPPPVADGIPFE